MWKMCKLKRMCRTPLILFCLFNTTHRYPKALRPPLGRKNRLAGARCSDLAQAGRKGSPKRGFRRRGADRLPHPDHGRLACRQLVCGESTAPAVAVRLEVPSRIRDHWYVTG